MNYWLNLINEYLLPVVITFCVICLIIGVIAFIEKLKYKPIPPPTEEEKIDVYVMIGFKIRGSHIDDNGDSVIDQLEFKGMSACNKSDYKMTKEFEKNVLEGIFEGIKLKYDNEPTNENHQKD